VARIRLADEYDRVFVAAHLCTQNVQRYFRQELRTVSQPTLNIKQIAETRLTVPPLELQREFAARMEALHAIKSSHATAVNGLESLFSSLQHHAFRGEL
jgi:type I restriction enzyme S subunit